MHIAIIGSGNVGAALGKGWLNAGHQVIFGVRNPQSEKTKKITGHDFLLNTIADAIVQSDVIVIATPPEAIHDLIPYLINPGEKVIIDTTNSFRSKPEGYATAYHAIQALTNAKNLVKCFNSTGFENMANPHYHLNEPVPHDVCLDMYTAGNSEYAKMICNELAKDLGFANCYNFGGDDKVLLLEQFALCWINLAIMQGQGRNIGFKLIRRD